PGRLADLSHRRLWTDDARGSEAGCAGNAQGLGADGEAMTSQWHFLGWIRGQGTAVERRRGAAGDRPRGHRSAPIGPAEEDGGRVQGDRHVCAAHPGPLQRGGERPVTDRAVEPAVARDHSSAADLVEVAEEMSRRYFEGRLRPTSIRWVTNQNVSR